MLSNSYCRTWLGHALGKLQGARAKHDTGHEGWASLVWQSLALGWCCPEPGACAGVPRVCVCAGPALLQGPIPTSLCFARRFCRFQSAARSPGWESLSFHLKAATMWQRTISTLSVHKQRGTQSQSQTCRFMFAQPNSSCSEEKQLYTEGRLVLCEGAAGVAQQELSWEELVHFPVNKNSCSFVIFHYLKVWVVACFGLFVCFFLWN